MDENLSIKDDKKVETKVCKIETDGQGNIVPESMEKIKEAGAILARGGLVAFPTETVYGLGGDGMNASASAKIYAAKGRPSDNPLIIHIGNIEALDDLTKEVSSKALQLAKAFWPGPLTMIFKKKETVPFETTGGLDTVAIRYPNHPVAKALILASGTYIAAPSANTSGRPSPTTAAHVIEDMNGKIQAIVDDGSVDIGIESTIVDVSGQIPVILRPGYITKAMLEEVVGKVEIDPAILSKPDPHLRPKAPGMKYRHYAPKGDLTIVQGETKAVITAINQLVLENQQAGKKTGVIATDESRQLYQCQHILSIGSRNDETSIAHNLYSVLREMDNLGIDMIYSENFGEGSKGQAIMNRLLKAAGYKVINV